MLDSELQSDRGSDRAVLRSVRADSRVRAEFAALGRATHVGRLYETGSLRLRFPRGQACEAVVLNTGGGITGGDRLAIGLTLETGAEVVATSQAAEKLYRSDGPPATISVRADLADGAQLAWLPQETILFDHANVERSLVIDMATTARLTVLETLALGRIASGERITSARWRDTWRIRRGGKLVFAENVRLDGAISDLLQRPAIGCGATSVATLVHIAPDAEQRLDAVRATLASGGQTCGCSAWKGMLVARFAAVELHKMRATLSAAVMAATGLPPPRSWSC